MLAEFGVLNSCPSLNPALLYTTAIIHYDNMPYVAARNGKSVCFGGDRGLRYCCPLIWGEEEDLVSRRQRGDCRRLFFCARSAAGSASKDCPCWRCRLRKPYFSTLSP